MHVGSVCYHIAGRPRSKKHLRKPTAPPLPDEQDDAAIFGDSGVRASASFSADSNAYKQKNARFNNATESGSMLSRRHSEAVNSSSAMIKLSQQQQQPSRALAPPLPPPRRSSEKLPVQRIPTVDISDDDFNPRKCDAEQVHLLDYDEESPKLDHLYSVPKKREPPPLPPKISRANSRTLVDIHNPFNPLLFDETSTVHTVSMLCWCVLTSLPRHEHDLGSEPFCCYQSICRAFV